MNRYRVCTRTVLILGAEDRAVKRTHEIEAPDLDAAKREALHRCDAIPNAFCTFVRAVALFDPSKGDWILISGGERDD